MTERRKDLLTLGFLFIILLCFYGRILFTDKIIRAPDIINEFYWGVEALYKGTLWDAVKMKFSASWNIEINGGVTDEGGGIATYFHFYRGLIFALFPPPSSVAWFIVLHLFFGSAGIYYCCRLIGVGRPGALFGALIFVLAPETASLINAGHVIKIATICFAPWAFWALEHAFQKRKLVWFMATSVILAFQFFGGHWQIAYYTCLAIACYAAGRILIISNSPAEREEHSIPRLVGLNFVVILFFLTTVAISLAPLANWSTDTNRGVQSGANQGKGGLEREEAMSWSLPPEESVAFVIPGFFGLSRQEGGPNPTNIASYYWGRMVFTQTVSYMGLLPWLLVPLPLIFRRDKYTILLSVGLVVGLVFSMGKYTPFYTLLYDYFPGINRFRVPKMMMFIPVMGLAVLAARGLELLFETDIINKPAFRRYLVGIVALAFGLWALFCSEILGQGAWLNQLSGLITAPNRFEQGPQLVMQRWENLVRETAIAAIFSSICAAVFVAFYRRWLSVNVVLVVLIIIFLGDVWRINDKFMFLIPVPEHSRGIVTPVSEFLAKQSRQFRTLPMDGTDPMFFVTQKIPVLFTSNPVQKRRWQEFLDNFTLNSSMTDMLNVKYLVYSAEQYSKEQGQLYEKYRPVFRSPDGRDIVLENTMVLPKAWLVPSVAVIDGRFTAPQALQSPSFDPRRLALVETPPPIPMASAGAMPEGFSTAADVVRYEGNHIEITTSPTANSLLVLSEKFYQGWKAKVDGKPVEIYPVNHVLRGVYLTPGKHSIELRFDPLPFKVGKYLTLLSLLLFVFMLVREILISRRMASCEE